MTCLFCTIASKQIPSYKIWEDDEFFAFLDIMPINPGHVLLIPKAHAEEVYDMPDDMYQRMFLAAKKLSQPFRQATGAKKIGIAVEGFGVAHAHVHLVPLHAGNELNPERAAKASDESLAEMQRKITAEIDQL